MSEIVEAPPDASGASNGDNNTDDVVTTTTTATKKPVDEVIRTLRCELRDLYESLTEKNDQMLLLERDIRDRDASIKFLRAEFQKLREQHGRQHHNQLVVDKHESSATGGAANATNGNGAIDEDLQKKLARHDALIKELSEKCIRLTHDLTYVQRKSFAKDDRIRELQNEIDKFRQVVRPLTQAMLDRKRSDSYFDEWSQAAAAPPGVESTRVLSLQEPRMKRQAISAEPLSAMAGMEGELVKIPKSSL